MSGYETVPL